MSSNRGFIWLDDASTNTTTTIGNGVLESTSIISWPDGTVITNNSLTTNDITVVNINGADNQPVVFPDGIKAQPLYYDDAYELTPGHMNVHHNNVKLEQDCLVNGLLKVDSIHSNLSSVLDIQQNVSISGNLDVLGSTTTLSSTNTNFFDRYLAINLDYTGGNISSGLVSNRGVTGSSFSLSGNFDVATGTVGTTTASGLAADSIIQISGSTSNNGLFQVLSHTGNVLTIKNSAEPYCANIFNTEVATGVAYTCNISGIEFSSTGVPVWLNENQRNNIAYNTSSPNFTAVESGALTLTGTTEDNTKTQFLVRDGTSGLVSYRNLSSIGTSNTESSASKNILNTAGTTLGTVTCTVNSDSDSDRTLLSIGSFNITLAAASSKLRIVLGSSTCTSHVWFPIMLKFVSEFENCTAVHCYDSGTPNNSEIVIVRNNGMDFPIGTVKHGIDNFGPVGVPIITQHVYFY